MGLSFKEKILEVHISQIYIYAIALKKHTHYSYRSWCGLEKIRQDLNQVEV